MFVLVLLPLAVGRRYCGLDLSLLDVPLHHALREALLSGELPLVLEGEGFAPWIGRPESFILYPGRWLTLALPAEVGATVFIALHLALAAAGSTWLARTYRVRPQAAAAVGVAVALSGTALDLTRHAIYLADIAWVPLAWAAARRALHPRRDPSSIMLLGGAASMALLMGEPFAFGLIVGLTTLSAVGALRRGRRATTAVVEVTIALVAAFLVALVLWLPVFAELAVSSRAGTLPPAAVLLWSFESSLWPGVLLPNVLFELSSDGLGLLDALGVIGAPTGAAWNPTPYLGGLVVVGAIAASVSRRGRPVVLLALVSLLGALGHESVLATWCIEHVPGASVLRYPAKLFVLTTIASVLAAGIALDEAARRTLALRRLVFGAAAFVLAGLAALISSSSWASTLDAAAGSTGAASVSTVVVASMATGLIGAGAAILFADRFPLAGYRRFLPLLLPLDLVVAAPGAVLTCPPMLDDGSAMTTLLAGAADEPRETPPTICHAPALDVRRRVTGDPRVDHLLTQRLHSFPAWHVVDGLRAPMWHTPIAGRAEGALLERVDRCVSCARALGCDVVVHGPRGPTLSHLDERAPPAVRLAASPLLRLVPLAAGFPAAEVLRSPRLVDEPGLLAAIDRGEPVRDLVVWSSSDPMPSPATMAASASATVEVLFAEPADLRLRVSGGPAVLAVDRRFSAGWSAIDEGEHELPVVRIGGVRVGVVVDAAAPTAIDLRYRPRRFGVGAAASAVGLALLWGLARRRRQERGDAAAG